MSEKHILMTTLLLQYQLHLVSLFFWTTIPAPLLFPTLLIRHSSTELLLIIRSFPTNPPIPLQAFLVGWPKPPCFVFLQEIITLLVSTSKACVVFACTNFEVASLDPIKFASSVHQDAHNFSPGAPQFSKELVVYRRPCSKARE